MWFKHLVKRKHYAEENSDYKDKEDDVVFKSISLSDSELTSESFNFTLTITETQ